MPLTSGALTAARFRLLGTLPSDLEDALEPHWFHLPLSPTVSKSTGFCTIDEPTLCTGADLNRWLSNEWVVLGWRVDEKKINQPRFKAELQARLKAWCTQNDRVKAPASVREELSETLKMEMLTGMIATLKVTELAISRHEGVAIVGSTSAVVLEEIQKAVLRAFGVRLCPDGHLGTQNSEETEDFESLLAVADAGWDPRQDTWSRPGSGGIAVANDEPLRFSRAASAAGFLGWLWGLAEQGNGVVDIEDGSTLALALQDTMGLAMPGAEHDEVTVNLDAPGASHEARAALRKGRIPTRMGLWVRREDREYAFSLCGAPFSLRAIRLPIQVKTGEFWERWLDRMFTYAEIVWLVERLLRRYAQVQCSSVEGPKWVARWSHWLERTVEEREE